MNSKSNKMLHNKDTKKISELKLTFVDSHKKQDFFTNIIEVLKIGKHHALFSSVKQKGISCLFIIKILITFPFIEQKTVHKFVNSYWNKYVKFGKDVYYRLKNNPKINWRGFLFAVLKRTLITIDERKTEQKEDKKQVKTFIFDDTTTAKTGKFIEGISYVWNHVIKKHVIGYQLLVMGMYDGTMFIPINFSFHREKGKNKKKPYGLLPKYLRKQFYKKRKLKSNGAIRKKELDLSKIKAMVKMIKSAVKQNVFADYVLTDSWFTCWETVKTTLENSMQYIGRFSKSKTNFKYNGKKLTYKQIQRINRKNMKRNKRFNLYYIRTVVQWHDKDIVLYATRKGENGNWKCFISTDLSLNFTKTIEIYQIRWTIEVFFKESKQLLNLGKSQSQDFDAQIADITLVMIQYIFLILQNRIEKYESLGKIFEQTKQNSLELKLHERLIKLLIAIIDVIATLFEQADYDDVFKNVMQRQDAYDKLLLLTNYQHNNLKTSA